MKLWEKIALICGIVFSVTAASCMFILIRETREELLSSARIQALDKHRLWTDSFREMYSAYSSGEDTETVKYVLAKYCFSRVTAFPAVLVWDGEVLYSDTDIMPQRYVVLEDPYEEKQLVKEIEGRQILITGSFAGLYGMSPEFGQIYTIEDITFVYSGMKKLTFEFLLICMGCILVGMLFIILLVRRSMRPLVQLQKVASHIAEGSFQERAAAESSDEVGKLAMDFNRMADAVEKQIEELTQTAYRQQLFIGGVTHEFKTPLTVLMLGIDTLQNTYMEEEEKLESLAQMEVQCKWLERLVQKLLKLISLNQEPERKEISARWLLEKVRDSVSEKLRSRSVELELICGEEKLFADPDLMRSALVNLVDNAVKASDAGQKVTLSVAGNLIQVEDRGVGIPEEALSHVTEPFFMADSSRNKKQGGVGLGLALVAKIVEAHGASLGFESTPGVGTCVKICMPQ